MSKPIIQAPSKRDTKKGGNTPVNSGNNAAVAGFDGGKLKNAVKENARFVDKDYIPQLVASTEEELNAYNPSDQINESSIRRDFFARVENEKVALDLLSNMSLTGASSAQSYNGVDFSDFSISNLMRAFCIDIYYHLAHTYKEKGDATAVTKELAQKIETWTNKGCWAAVAYAVKAKSNLYNQVVNDGSTLENITISMLTLNGIFMISKNIDAISPHAFAVYKAISVKTMRAAKESENVDDMEQGGIYMSKTVNLGRIMSNHNHTTSATIYNQISGFFKGRASSRVFEEVKDILTTETYLKSQENNAKNIAEGRGKRKSYYSESRVKKDGKSLTPEMLAQITAIVNSRK